MNWQPSIRCDWEPNSVKFPTHKLQMLGEAPQMPAQSYRYNIPKMQRVGEAHIHDQLFHYNVQYEDDCHSILKSVLELTRGR